MEVVREIEEIISSRKRQSPDVLLLDVTVKGLDSSAVLRHLKPFREGEKFFPVLLVTPRNRISQAVRGLEAGADGYIVRPFNLHDVTAHLQAVLRLKRLQEELVKKNRQIGRINTFLKTAYSRIDKELQLARKLQSSLFPQKFPELPGVCFAGRHFSSGSVTGDFYDVFRLDETHFGFYVADVIGHGVASALLTVFVKKGIRTKDISGNTYTIVPPPEVLSRLNEDLISENLSETPFITMCYATYDLKTRHLIYSLAGHPPPVILRKGELVQLPETKGALLGVFTNEYTQERVSLIPRDRVVLYTDGIEGAIAEGALRGYEAFVKALVRRKSLPLDALIEELTGELFPEKIRSNLADDATFLILEVREG